jgi:hypothetical protein
LITANFSHSAHLVIITRSTANLSCAVTQILMIMKICRFTVFSFIHLPLNISSIFNSLMQPVLCAAWISWNTFVLCK